MAKILYGYIPTKKELKTEIKKVEETKKVTTKKNTKSKED